MYKKVSTDMNFVEREKQVEKFWEDNQIFEKSMKVREGNPSYVFYDGPPTANGKPHIGHVETRVIKDMIPRYRTMKGYQLVECCKRKDMTAQNELYQRYAGEMFALCIRYSGNRDFAKDLLHDGFLKAFTSLDKFFYRGEGSLKAWLSRIMVNTALEAIRKQTQHIELDIETAPEIADPENEDDDKIVKNIPQETLLRFISELPDGYRTVFNLFTFENKSHKEIANLLHINEKSSSSQLHRARTILMNRVKQYWAQYENG